MKKQILIKIEAEVFTEFSKLCANKGYTKTGWVKAQIKKFIKEEGKL